MRRDTTTCVKAVFPTVVHAQGDEPEITITTGGVDRVGDIVVPEGAQLAAYRRNPVVLYGHDHQELPVGSTTSISVEAGVGLRARWRWLQGDARAGRVRNAYEQDVLRAASIGFVPIEQEPLGRGGGYRFTRWELAEWSLCAVPANGEAVRVLRSLGLSAGVRRSDVAEALGLLRSIETKAGRVLSAANEREIREAVRLLEGVLAQLGEDDTEGQGARELPSRPGHVLVLDDEPEDVLRGTGLTSQAELEALVERVMAEALMPLTGRVY